MPAPITVYRSLGYVGMVREATPGTGEAPTKFFKYLEPVSFKPQQQIQYYRNGNERDMTVALKETFRHEGSFKALVYADEGAALMAWAMGKDTLSGAGDPYTHTLTLLDTIPWLGAEVGNAEGTQATTVALVDRIVDVKIASLLIEGQAGKQIYMTPTLIGLTSDFKDTTPTTQVFNDAAAMGPYTFQQSVFTMTSLGSDSSTMAGQIQNFKILLSQNLEPVYGPAQLPPIGAVERGRDCTLEFDVVFSGNTIYRLAYFGSTAGTAASATVGSGTFSIKATCNGSPEHSMTITCNNFDIASVDILQAPNADLCIVKVKGRMKKVSTTYPLTAVFLNAVSAAYTA